MEQTTVQQHTSSSFTNLTPQHRLFDALLTYLLAPGVHTEGRPVSTERTLDRHEAAHRLFAAVRALPELDPNCPPPHADREDADAELGELDMRLGDLARMHHVGGALQLHAEEIAARARLLQDECPSRERECSTILRRLTAIVAGRSVFVFGLCRVHQGDWRSRAARARALRERLSGTREIAIVETRRSERIVTRAVQSESEPPPDLSELRMSATSGAIIVVGGAGRSHVRDEVARRANVDIEWVETHPRGGTRLVEPIVTRLKGGGITAVVIVDGAIRHDAYRVVIEAVRTSSTPVAYAKKGGVTQVVHALLELERQLASRQNVVPAA